jgi:DNA topoisomerase-3
MERYAESLARQKGLRPPTGYETSISICRAFLDEHAAKKADVEERKPERRARTRRASGASEEMDIARNAEGTSIAKPSPLKAKRAAPRAKSGREHSQEFSDIPAATKKRRTIKRQSRSSADAIEKSNSESAKPLRIPYGNKEIAMKLGARYGSSGWYAPPGIDLSAFRERGWT